MPVEGLEFSVDGFHRLTRSSSWVAVRFNFDTAERAAISAALQTGPFPREVSTSPLVRMIANFLDAIRLRESEHAPVNDAFGAASGSTSKLRLESSS